MAYRYERVNNPDAPTRANPYLRISYTRSGNSYYLNPQFSLAKSSPELYDRAAFQVEAVHLGAHFVGGVDDMPMRHFDRSLYA